MRGRHTASQILLKGSLVKKWLPSHAVWEGRKLFLHANPPRDKCGSMKFHTEYLTLHTKTKRAYVHLTPQVESALKKSGIKDGMILVSAMHITAGDEDHTVFDSRLLRSEEHTSELQSHSDLVCRLLLEKKKQP